MKKILDFAKEREARLAKPRIQDKAKLMVVTRDATGSIVTCQDAPIYTVEAAKSRYSIRNMRTKQVQSNWKKFTDALFTCNFLNKTRR